MTKLIACSQTTVDSLLSVDKLPHKFLNDNHREIRARYQKHFPATKFFYDRTKTIPHFLDVDSEKYPIPDISGFNLSLDEVCERRAKELLSLGKVINVSWSGGIDSTFALLTLYYYANDKSQIRVYGTYNSVIESGNVFDKYINGKIPFDIHCNRSIGNNYPLKENEIYVTGSMGNDIFYPDNVKGARDSWMILKDNTLEFKDLLNQPYEHVLSDLNLEFLNDFIKKCPRKIETLQDLRWWVSFSFNWHTCGANSYIGIGADRAKQIHPFFGSDDFQRWSIVNTDQTTKTGDYTDERWQLRDKIAEYTGNSDYSKEKRNVVSVLSNFGNNWVFLMNDYSNVYLQDL